MRTTVGQLMINDALPDDLRDYTRSFDKKGTRELFRQIAEKYPDRYKEIAAKLMDIGQDISHNEGSSIRISELVPARIKEQRIGELRKQLNLVTDDRSLSTEDRNRKIIEIVAPLVGKLDKEVVDEGFAEGNTLSSFIRAGARGNQSNVNQLRGAPLMVMDNQDNPVPIPILNNFSEGLDPAEYFATTFGVRKGYVDIKGATPKAGYLGKQLANASHRLVVTDDQPLAGTGLPVDADDEDNIGAVLARDTGPYKAGAVISTKIHKELQRYAKRILVHSPVSAIGSGDGVPRIAAGYREKDRFADVGDNIGIASAQAISEPLSQAVISSKHTAGVAGASGGGSSANSQRGFSAVNNFVNIPKTFPGAAAIAEADGVVTGVRRAPQGGSYVKVGGDEFYVEDGQEVIVKNGERIEAGDALSDGLPNPADIVRHKGVGEGRRYFTYRLRDILRNSGVTADRRNLELLARGMVNKVRITDPDEAPSGTLPGDVVDYDYVAARYTPRQDAKTLSLSQAKDTYLEQPYLHYSIGTRVTPRVTAELKEFGVNEVITNARKPAFEPEMHRAVDALESDRDWMTRLGGFNLQKQLLDATHRGQSSEVHSTSYIPALANATGFGLGEGGKY